MNQVSVVEKRSVNFNGANLLAAKGTNGKVYVGVRWVCEGIGLSRGHKNRQIGNVQTDLVLKQGCIKFDAGVFDDNNGTLAIELDYLPLWLAKISITPAMVRDQPDTVSRLVEYQVKAKEVLAQAFVSKEETPSYMIENPAERARRWAEEYEESEQLKIELQNKEKEIEHKEDVIINLVDNVDLAQKRQVLNRVVRQGGQYQDRWKELYTQFNLKYHVNVQRRLESYNASNSPKIKSKLDYIQNVMGKLPELYEIACKLYQNDVDKLVNQMYYLQQSDDNVGQIDG